MIRLHLVILVTGIIIFVIRIPDVNHVRFLREAVSEGFSFYIDIRDEVEEKFSSGRDVGPEIERGQSGVAEIYMDPRTGVVTITFKLKLVEEVNPTLILYPFVKTESGEVKFFDQSLRNRSNQMRWIRWVCTSSDSLILTRISQNIALIPGTLPSKYAPPECRY